MTTKFKRYDRVQVNDPMIEDLIGDGFGMVIDPGSGHPLPSGRTITQVKFDNGYISWVANWHITIVASASQPDEDPGEVRITNDKTGGAKGSKPCRIDLIPVDALWELGEHYGKGVAKYPSDPGEPDNWRKGYVSSLSTAAALRHMFQFVDGEDVDPETGSKHLIAAAWHCLTLVHNMNKANWDEFDDRQSVLEKRFAEYLKSKADEQ